MAIAKSYKELLIWQRSILLCKNIYELTSNFPKEEIYGITNQMRRSSISISSNIAEGFGRSNATFINYLRIARGSLYELDTQVTISKELFDHIHNDLFLNISNELNEIGKMLNSLINKLNVKN